MSVTGCKPAKKNPHCGCAKGNSVVTFVYAIGNVLLICGEKPARSEEHPSLGELFPQLHFQRLGRLLAELRMRIKVKLQLERC